MKLSEKIELAQILVNENLIGHSKPIVYSSFGKDSMVLLDITRRMGYKFPVLFHRESFCPKKYWFANNVIDLWDLVVYDYPPFMTSVAQTEDCIEVMNHYNVGVTPNLLGTGIKEPEKGKPFLCAYWDFYDKPVGVFNYPWDVAFIGHKNCDHCPIRGDIPLGSDSHQFDKVLVVFPLRNFTDKDIWDYTEQFDVPYNNRRYDRNNGYKEFEDVEYNNDYYHACTNCLDKNKSDTVWCPKLGKEIKNRSKVVRVTDLTPPKYFK